MELYKQISDANRIKYGTEAEKILRIIINQYSDRTHFIYEILQNAEDAGATRIQFHLEKEKLVIEHNGRPFNEKDIEGVCGIANGTKEDGTRIGHFGIGFKSVYCYTEHPYIYSGEYHFVIQNQLFPAEVSGRKEIAYDETCMILPFDKNEVPSGVAYQEIRDALTKKITAESIIMLDRISDVKIKIDGYPEEIEINKAKYSLDKKTYANNVFGLSMNTTIMNTSTKQTRTRDADYLFFTDANREATAIIFRVEGKELKAIKNSKIYAFFPTAKDNFKEGAEYGKHNIELVKAIGELIWFAFQWMKNHRYLSVSGFNTVFPVYEYENDDVLYGIYQNSIDMIREEALLPTNVPGEFKKIQEICVPLWGIIVDIFDDNDLRTLRKNRNISWLAKEFSTEAYRDVRAFLNQNFKLETLEWKDLVLNMDAFFLSQKQLSWMEALLSRIESYCIKRTTYDSHYIDVSQIPKPYSYRVDITADGETETYYIGAADVVLKDGKKVISANSDLGYELINYQTIKVHKDGKEYSIKLSRQFDIDHASLYGYTNLRTDEDVIFQSGITDPFLVRVLNMRKKQHSLTDIFVTIQENQNKIVNTDFKKNIIVQGCAGSGKTMVLLHRLSALKYKQRYFDFSQNALILTPNEEFSLHIQGLAEGLQIGSVHRLSVEQYYLEMLLQYDAAFKPENKIVSEMQVRQDYVDYIYSDQFKRDFDQAYNSILAKRNGLVDILIQLQEAMGLENNPFSWTDESRFTVQMKYRVDTLNDLVRKKEQDVVSAQEKITKLEERKAFLEDRIPASKHFAENIVQESLPRVNTKIGEYILEKQQEITELNKKIQDLQEEYTRIQGTLIMFGKRSRLEKLDADIKEVEAVVIPLQQQLDEQKKILSIEQEGKEDDEILAWMKQVSIYVKKVQDEVRLCSNTKDEYSRFSNELNETVDNIKIAYEKYHRIDAEQYSADIKKTVQYLYEQLEQYSLLNIYHQIYDESVRVFKETNAIKSITGKCHRYDLYIQLMFAMRYFNKRTVQKMKYLDMDILPENTRKIIGETMDNGFISIMYVDEVKGI